MSRSERASLTIVLGALSAFAPLSIDMYLPSLPSLGDDLHASSSAVQLTLTACLAGLALGQILAGPVSDRLGRRAPVLAGVALYAVASGLCAIAPSIAALVVLRLVQGLAGSAGIVISRAVVSDLHAGQAAARLYAALLAVNGVAPIVAPVLGAQLLHVTDWRGVFGVLAAVGALLWVAALRLLPETLPAARRSAGGLAQTSRVLREVARDRWFVGHALVNAFVFAAMFSYIAGSPFVLQDIYGASPQAFSAVFAVNGAGLVLAGVLNTRLLARYAPGALLRLGVLVSAAGAALLLVVVGLGGLGVGFVLPPLFLVVASLGVVLPNATALAMDAHRAVAGSASALLGCGMYALGAATAPLVGVAGQDTALPMALTIAALAGGAVASLALVSRGGAPRGAVVAA